jgi:DNA-binding CsgD family transcriptional regulator
MRNGDGNEPFVRKSETSGPMLDSGTSVRTEPSVTPRQLEMLALYASGYGYEDIGRMKFFSPYTVRNYLKQAVARTGSRNITSLCTTLVDVGMIRKNEDGVWEPVVDLRIAE